MKRKFLMCEPILFFALNKNLNCITIILYNIKKREGETGFIDQVVGNEPNTI